MDHWKTTRFRGKNHPVILRNIFPGMSALKFTSYSPFSLVNLEGLCHRQFFISHWRSFINIITWLHFSNGNNCHKRTWQKNTNVFGLKTPKKANLSNISPSYEQSFLTSSWTSPSSPKTNDRKEAEADEEQQATQNTIKFKKPVKLYIITRRKTNPIIQPENIFKFPPTSR